MNFRPNRNKIINAIEKVSVALSGLADKVAVVGGAVVGLYANDPGAPDVRPTNDIDLVFEIATYLELEKLENTLKNKGFRRSMEEKIMCRFLLDNVLVDVMATKEVGWAPANRWFEKGFKVLLDYYLVNTKIKILPFEYFLATKFSAFEDRGADPRTSHDFEDIVYLLDNRLGFVTEIKKSDREVKAYLIRKLSELIDPGGHEAVMAHLAPETQTERFKIIIEKVNQILTDYPSHSF